MLIGGPPTALKGVVAIGPVSADAAPLALLADAGKALPCVAGATTSNRMPFRFTVTVVRGTGALD